MRRARRQLLPVTQSGVLPSRPVPADATRFRARVRLPTGRSTLVFRGTCGLDTRVVEVPARGAVPDVVVTLPPQQSGGLQISQQSAEPRRLQVRREGAVVAWVDLGGELGGPVRLDGLAPGDYRLGRPGARSACQRTVTVPPGETTDLLLESTSCVSEPLPPSGR